MIIDYLISVAISAQAIRFKATSTTKGHDHSVKGHTQAHKTQATSTTARPKAIRAFMFQWPPPPLPVPKWYTYSKFEWEPQRIGFSKEQAKELWIEYMEDDDIKRKRCPLTGTWMMYLVVPG